MESDASETAARTTGEEIMTEFQRLHALAAGQYWIADPQKLLFCCLTNTPAKDNHLVEFDGTIPSSYVDAAKFLYQLVGQSDDQELKSPDGYDMAAEIICGACLTYLQKELSPEEFGKFKAETPIRKFKSIMEEMFAMLKEA
jgi:hypothetical protein